MFLAIVSVANSAYHYGVPFKSLLSLLLLTLFSVSSFGQLKLDGLTRAQQEEKVRKWMQANDEAGNNTWLIESIPKITASNQKIFFEKLKATGSGNGGDPLAGNFVDTARKAIGICSLMKVLPAKEAKILSHSFYKMRVFSVPFNLCADDSSDCEFESSYVAKNFPEENLVLVNAIKWNLLTHDQRISIAAHEILGLLGIETGSYGVSSTIKYWTEVVHSEDRKSFQVYENCTIHKK